MREAVSERYGIVQTARASNLLAFSSAATRSLAYGSSRAIRVSASTTVNTVKRLLVSWARATALAASARLKPDFASSFSTSSASVSNVVASEAGSVDRLGRRPGTTPVEATQGTFGARGRTAGRVDHAEAEIQGVLIP